MAVSLHHYYAQSLSFSFPRLSADWTGTSFSLSSRSAKRFDSKTLALCSLSCRHALQSYKPTTSHAPIDRSWSRDLRRWPCLATQESTPSTRGEVKDCQTDTDGEAYGIHASSVITLIQEYKDAVREGDLKTLSAIEAKVLTIDKERNELIQKVSSLTSQIISEKETYLRLQADFDNFRKRTEKERMNARSNAQVEVLEGLLRTVDNFERAKKQIKPETEKEKKIDISYQGIYRQFVEIMRSHQVSVIATVGRPFDPSLHEAIAREESQKFKEGIITHEIRRGFMLRDQLLRPAMVKVSSGPGSKKAEVAAEKSTEQPATAIGVEER